MDVVRHNHIASDSPFRGMNPSINDQIVDFIAGEDATALKGVCSYVQNDAQVTE